MCKHRLSTVLIPAIWVLASCSSPTGGPPLGQRHVLAAAVMSGPGTQPGCLSLGGDQFVFHVWRLPSEAESAWATTFASLRPTCEQGTRVLDGKTYGYPMPVGSAFMFTGSDITRNAGSWLVVDHRADGFWFKVAGGTLTLLKPGTSAQATWPLGSVKLQMHFGQPAGAGSTLSADAFAFSLSVLPPS